MIDEFDYVEGDGGFAPLNIGDGIGPFPVAGTYRISVPFRATQARRYLRQDDGPPPGPWLKLTPDGIQIVTPPADLDEIDHRGNIVHTISRERAQEIIHTLQWMVDAKVEVVTDV